MPAPIKTDIQKLAFPCVNSRLGAPMGRRLYGCVSTVAPRSVYLFRMRLVDGCYDIGGAYWGSGTMWVAFSPALDGDEGLFQVVRAASRASAAVALGIPSEALKRGLI